MAFVVKKKKRVSVESPEALFNDLRGRRTIEGLLSHQADILRSYVEKGLDAPDVALQLPTGSGKTLVGLLLGEWRRLKNSERVVYLCPTNQLVHQVAEQSRSKYGIDVTVFTGPKGGYDPADVEAYLSGESIGITSYSSLFNIKPFFNENHLIVLDDAHASENYISSAWSLHIDRRNSAHLTLFDALVNVIRPLLTPTTLDSLTAKRAESRWDEGWVESIPLPSFISLESDLTSVIEANIEGAGDLVYPWRWLKGHLDACHVYLARGEILIRPLIPPTDTHPPFANARQRLYMSATLGSGGDLERITGRRSILRMPVSPTWAKQGVGRRLFFFPASSLPKDEVQSLTARMIERAGRAVVLTTGFDQASKLTTLIENETGFTVFDAKEIETSKDAFLESDTAVAIIANRFDGIDFPGDQSRLLIVDQLPRATNLQESFFSSKVGANILLNDRVMTRVVQGFGRCTRAATDYAAVVVTGETLFSYLIPTEKRGFFHPELQAEIEFGIDQSRKRDADTFLENLNIFLSRSAEWQEADASIVELRQGKKQRQLPGTESLRKSVPFEVDYQYALWAGRYTDALDAARSVLAALKEDAVRGYRALWNYFAGNAAWLAEQNGHLKGTSTSSQYFRAAQKGIGSTRWLMDLARYSLAESGDDKPTYLPASLSVIERLEREIEIQGVATNFNFDEAEARILSGLNSSNGKQFELAHLELGRLLGYDAGKIESDASPDPWWSADDSFCFVFEDHAGAKSGSMIDATKARQAATHENWIRDKIRLRDDAKVLMVMITPATRAKSGALPHIKKLLTWPLQDFKEWSLRALASVRELRKTFTGVGDIEWKASALDIYHENAITPHALCEYIENRSKEIKWQELK